jgi:signal transduction histidine kinase
MVQKAMERMGGRVWAESQVGAGAVFYLQLPLSGPASGPFEQLQEQDL